MSHIFENLYVFAAGLALIFYKKAIVIVLFAALLIVLLIFQIFTRRKFKSKQLEYPKVKDAILKKHALMKDIFESNGINYPPRRIFIRIFKEERILELWASPDRKRPFILIKGYEIFGMNVIPGPKRQQGDNKIPEGFYYIDKFNPNSKYYLSLGLNYPNESDYALGVRKNLGGDIYIHGGKSTAGCIAITDDKIKELYIIAVEAVASGQDRIPVHIFPRSLNDKDYNDLKEKYKDDYSLISFWDNTKEGYDAFENTHILPKISITTNGKYIFKRR